VTAAVAVVAASGAAAGAAGGGGGGGAAAGVVRGVPYGPAVVGAAASAPTQKQKGDMGVKLLLLSHYTRIMPSQLTGGEEAEEKGVAAW
jgi:hypothetical protein